jgi:hypothetical protein
MTPGRRVIAIAITAVTALGIAGLSRLPAAPLEQSQPVLRLSWRVLGVRVEECRTRSAEELEALAPHMRTAEACTGGGADYELRVRIDGAEVARDTVRPAGARRDRPIYVFRDLEVDVGRHDVSVDFAALVPATYEAGDARLAYAWRGDIEVASAEIALVTLNPSGDALVLRSR